MTKLTLTQTALLACTLSSVLAVAQAPQKTGADFLPPSTGIYIEMPRPAAFLDQVIEHPVRDKIEALPQVATFLSGPKYKGFRGIVAYLELQLGHKWDKAFAELAGRGMYFAADPETEGAALLLHAENQAILKKSLTLLIDTVQGEAKKKNQPDPVEEGMYRGIRAVKIGKAYFARVGDWMVITGNSSLGQAILDRFLDGGDSLRSAAKFTAPSKMKLPGGTAWAYLDLPAVRDAGLAKGLFMDRLDNPIAELVLGGFLASLKRTPFTSVNLKLDDKRLAVVGSMPNNPSWLGEPRRFHAPNGAGTAVALTPPSSTIFQGTMSRDFQAWWLAAEDLYTERAFAKFQEADSNLANLFGGKNVGTDILNLLGHDAQILMTRIQAEERGGVTPEIQLPGFAVAFQMKDPARTGRQLKNSFNNLMGFLNIAGAQKEQAQFELDMDRVGDGKMYFAEPIASEEMEIQSASMEFNFSPALLLKGDMAILSSHRVLVTQLAAAPQSSVRVKATPMKMTLSAANLGRILYDNRTQLVVKNMLKKGQRRPETEANIDTMLRMLKLFDGISLEAIPSETVYRVDAVLNFSN